MPQQVTDMATEVSGDRLNKQKSEGSKKTVLTTGYKGFTLRPREGMALFRAVMANPMSQLDDDFIEQMTLMVEAGNFPETAAASLGIPEHLWTKWWEAGCKLMQLVQNDPKSINLMSYDEENLMMLVVSVGRAMAENERALVARVEYASRFDWAAAAWLLSKLQPEKWGKRRDMPEQNITVNNTVNTGVLAVAPQQKKDDWLNNFKDVQLIESPELQDKSDDTKTDQEPS